jgi:hypothetical protein
VHDGPYASSKEQLDGFMLLELPSLDAAVEWAARCPAASYGAVEAPDREVVMAQSAQGSCAMTVAGSPLRSEIRACAVA